MKKCANGPFYDTKSPDYGDQHMRANTWEGIGKELKIKRKFYVSSRDVRIMCPRLEATVLLSADICAGGRGTTRRITMTELLPFPRVHTNRIVQAEMK